MPKNNILKKSSKTQQIVAAIVVLLVAVIGTRLLIGSHAASPYTSTTAYNGTLANGAQAEPCASAANTSCVEFEGSNSGKEQANCLQLQSDGIHPVYSTLDACGYPSPDSTGPPAGTTLTTVGSGSCSNDSCLPANTVWDASTGELGITGPTTINDLYIPGYVYFVTSDYNYSGPNADPVTIENSKIEADTGGTLVDLQGASNVTIKYTDVSGTYTGTACSGPASYDIGDSGTNDIVDHDDLACSGEPINGSGFTLTNSYLIADGYPAGEHVEDFYIPGGGSDEIENNTLLNPNNQTATIFGDAKLGALSNLTIENNLLATGGTNGDIAVGCYASGVANEGYGYDTNVTVENNRLSEAYNTSSMPFIVGNTDGGPGTTWSNNYMDSNPSDVISQPVGAC